MGLWLLFWKHTWAPELVLLVYMPCNVKDMGSLSSVL